MSAKIAVFLHNAFNNVPSAMKLRVLVFERKETMWNQTDERYVNLDPTSGLVSYRENVKKLLNQLVDCRIAAGPEFSGVLYMELDSRGFSIFETPDCSPETLDGILRDLDAAAAEEEAAAIPVIPVETETPGVYRLDLMQLQEAFPEITSKQALRDFLETVPFYELHLVCGHVPPWIESGPYDVSLAPVGENLRATIRKKQC